MAAPRCWCFILGQLLRTGGSAGRPKPSRARLSRRGALRLMAWRVKAKRAVNVCVVSSSLHVGDAVLVWIALGGDTRAETATSLQPTMECHQTPCLAEGGVAASKLPTLLSVSQPCARGADSGRLYRRVRFVIVVFGLSLRSCGGVARHPGSRQAPLTDADHASGEITQHRSSLLHAHPFALLVTSPAYIHHHHHHHHYTHFHRYIGARALHRSRRRTSPIVSRDPRRWNDDPRNRLA